MADINILIHDATIGVLVLLSIVTWLFILIKVMQNQKVTKQNKQFIEQFWRSKNIQDAVKYTKQAEGSAARIAHIGFQTLLDANDQTHQDLQQTWSRLDLLERHLRKQILIERRQLEKGSAILASIGNNAPFIGLFGTVFGIIHALQAIAQSGNASMDVVAGPIGAALIATGMGIAVAVPAVLGYNYFVRKLKGMGADLDDFATDFVSLNQKSGFQIAADKTPSSTDKPLDTHLNDVKEQEVFA